MPMMYRRAWTDWIGRITPGTRKKIDAPLLKPSADHGSQSVTLFQKFTFPVDGLSLTES